MKKIIFNVSVLCALSTLLLSGCLKEDDAKSPEQILAKNLANVDPAQLASDIAVIDDSLQRRNITAQSEPNGVRYVVVSQGTGPMPTLRNDIRVNYKGSLLKNGSVFEQNNNAVLPLSALLLGWQTTLPLINKGSKVILYIPSGLAYAGSVQVDRDNNIIIPQHSNLVFEIEILDIF